MKKITPRELEVLLYVAEHGIYVTASELNLAPSTVKNHLSSVYKKLNARSMAHAVLIVANQGTEVVVERARF